MSARVLVLVLSVDGEYAEVIESIRATWGGDKTDEFDVCYYYPDREGMRAPPGRVVQHGDVLLTGFPAHVDSILRETLAVYDYIQRWDFDYTFRCCAGSYVVREQLLSWIDDKPRHRFYAGAPGFVRNVRYASGSGYFLSRDLVALVAQKAGEISAYGLPGFYDDVAIGRLMQLSSVPLVEAPRVNESDGGFVGTLSDFHYHVGKSPDWMRRIHQRMQERKTRS